MSVPLMDDDYSCYNGMKEWQHVYPAAEFGKDESDNLVFKSFNGLIMLTFDRLMSQQQIAEVKRSASLLPMTFAAFQGADGRSLVVLVRVGDEKDELPTTEAAAEQFYQIASAQVKNLYVAQVGIPVKAEKPTIRCNFLLTLDPTPYHNDKAVTMRIERQKPTVREPKKIDDLKTYEDYEYLYRKADLETEKEMKEAGMK